MNKHEEKSEKIEENIDETEESCQCSCDCCSDSEDISIKEVAYHADDKVDALIQLLLKKKIINEHEFEEEYNSLFEEDEKE
jgi:hypothetical protein